MRTCWYKMVFLLLRIELITGRLPTASISSRIEIGYGYRETTHGRIITRPLQLCGSATVLHICTDYLRLFLYSDDEDIEEGIILNNLDIAGKKS